MVWCKSSMNLVRSVVVMLFIDSNAGSVVAIVEEEDEDEEADEDETFPLALVLRPLETLRIALVVRLLHIAFESLSKILNKHRHY
jgi:hypothetical protein